MSVGLAQQVFADNAAFYQNTIRPGVLSLGKTTNTGNAENEILAALQTQFKKITGADLLEPFEVWKMQYISTAVQNEFPVALQKAKDGDRAAVRYVKGFDSIISASQNRLQDYITKNTFPQPPKGSPFEPAPFDPLEPVVPGVPVVGPPAPPAPPAKTNKMLLYVGGGLLLAKAFKII